MSEFSTDRYLVKSYDHRSYHCWHLVAEAWRELTGEDLHMSVTGRGGPDFEQVERPVSPCIVIMIRPNRPPHAGLFRNGRVLHIREDGAKYERLADAIRWFVEVRYYARRHADQGRAGSAGAVGEGPGRGRARLVDGAVRQLAG